MSSRDCITCAVCGEPPQSRCPCHTVYYCGPECQHDDWASHKAAHKAALAEKDNRSDKKSERPNSCNGATNSAAAAGGGGGNAADVGNAGRDSSTGRRASGEDALTELQHRVGGGLDLWQERDWPHRPAIDPLGDISLWAFPVAQSSPGGKNHDCEHCGQGCQCIHDNVVCWRCHATFCLHCTAPDGGPSGIARLSQRQILDGWGRCHKCGEGLRAIALPGVFLQMAAASLAANPMGVLTGPGAIEKALLTEAFDAFKRGEEAKTDEGAVKEFTHAISALNVAISTTSSVERRGIVNLGVRDRLLKAHAFRARKEGDKQVVKAIRKFAPTASFREATGDPEGKPAEKEWFVPEQVAQGMFLAAHTTRGESEGGDGAYVYSDTAFNAVHRDEMARALEGMETVTVDLRQKSLAEVRPSADFQHHVDDVVARACRGSGTAVKRRLRETLLATALGPDMSPQSHDADFTFFNGTYKGSMHLNQVAESNQMSDYVMTAARPVKEQNVNQFIWAFPSQHAAMQFARIKLADESFVEKRSGLVPMQPEEADLLKTHANCQQGGQRAPVVKAWAFGGTMELLPGLPDVRMYAGCVVSVVCNIVTKCFVSAFAVDLQSGLRYAFARCSIALSLMVGDLGEFRRLQEDGMAPVAAPSTRCTVLPLFGLGKNSDAGSMTKGTRVVISGLVSEGGKQYNGLSGVVVKAADAGGRITVKVQVGQGESASTTNIRVKRENVQRQA